MNNATPVDDAPENSGLLRSEITRRDLGRWAAAVAGAAVFAPRFISGLAADSGHGGTLSIARSGDADTLDPHHTVGGLNYLTFRHIYDPLLSQKMDLTFEGNLAESWEISADTLEYTFHLRKGIKFTDGSDFNADAVKFNFDRVMDKATAAPSAGWISALKETTVIDPYTVKMTLSTPFSPFLSNLSVEYFGMISPTAVAKWGENYGLNPVGTGPWKLKEWVAGEKITLEKNPDFQNFHSYVTNKGPALLDGLAFLNMPESQTQLAAFDTGQVNLIGLPPEEVKHYKESDSAQLFTSPDVGSIAYLEFATVAPAAGELTAIFKPPFDDLLLRQAVAYGVNAEEIIDTVMEGQANRNFGPMPMGLFAYNPDIEKYGYKFDADKAKQLIAQAGWVDSDGDGIVEKNGKKLEVMLWTWTDSTLERVIQVVQNQLGKVGISVKVQTQESGALFAALPTSDAYNMDFMIWGWPESDILYMMTDTNWGVGNYHDKQFRDLVSKAREVTAQKDRAALYFQAAQKMLADAAMVPLWTSVSTTAVRKEVKDVKLGPDGSPVVEDIYVQS